MEFVKIPKKPTFNLPDYIDKFIQGSNTAGISYSAGLPNIKGELTNGLGDQIGGSGAFSLNSDSSIGFNGGSYYWKGVNFNASSSNSIYGNSDTVQPPALTALYVIKY